MEEQGSSGKKSFSDCHPIEIAEISQSVGFEIDVSGKYEEGYQITLFLSKTV